MVTLCSINSTPMTNCLDTFNTCFPRIGRCSLRYHQSLHLRRGEEQRCSGSWKTNEAIRETIECTSFVMLVEVHQVISFCDWPHCDDLPLQELLSSFFKLYSVQWVRPHFAGCHRPQCHPCSLGMSCAQHKQLINSAPREHRQPQIVVALHEFFVGID
jgi:hypothetical protein